MTLKTPSGPRLRNKGIRRVRVAEIEDAPFNFRTHPEAQQAALGGTIDEIGFYGYPDVWEPAPGRLQLCDGHLRKELLLAKYGAEAEIDVNVTDFDEGEAKKATLTKDPLAAMAESDPVKLDALLRDVQTGDAAIQQMLADLADEAGLYQDDQPETGRDLDIKPQFSILIKCDDEVQQRAIIGELDTHGINTRALCIGWPEQPPIERPDKAPLELDQRRIVRKTAIRNSPRVKQLAGIYDLPPKHVSEHTWTVRITLDRPWNIGLIVGPSGCGKSTIAGELFGDKLVTAWPWPADASLIDGFPESLSLGDIINLLSSVGFSSPPHWLKPFHVLSNGEQFRVNLARTMAEMPDLAVIDEFTSVVDRTVAQIGSAAVAKAVRLSNRRLVAVTCHNDVEEWLQPDWKFEPVSNQFTWRSLRRRPEIQLQIRRVKGAEFWPRFRGHHYLSGDLHPTAACFMASVHGQPAAFAAAIHNPGKGGGWWREHRTICLPDFQGVGIGNALSNFVGGLFRATGKRYRSTTSHPAMIAHRMRSPLWRLIRAPGLAEDNAGAGFGGLKATQAVTRLTCGFEFLGEPRPDEARMFGVTSASPSASARHSARQSARLHPARGTGRPALSTELARTAAGLTTQNTTDRTRTDPIPLRRPARNQ